jgi:flagellar basal body-associated protein FliL
MRPPAAAPTAAPPPSSDGGKEAKAGKGKKKVADDEGGKKKKPIKPIAIAILLLLVAKVVMGKVEKPHYGPKHPVPAGAIYDFPNSITTNLPDGSLAQIGISLQMTKVGSSKVVTKDTSELEGTAVQIIGSQTYNVLLSVQGRAALQKSLLKAFQTELGQTEGAQAVSAVYFTSYVLQQQ